METLRGTPGLGGHEHEENSITILRHYIIVYNDNRRLGLAAVVNPHPHKSNHIIFSFVILFSHVKRKRA